MLIYTRLSRSLCKRIGFLLRNLLQLCRFGVFYIHALHPLLLLAILAKCTTIPCLHLLVYHDDATYSQHQLRRLQQPRLQ